MAKALSSGRQRRKRASHLRRMRVEARSLRSVLGGLSATLAVEVGGCGLDWVADSHCAQRLRIGPDPSRVSICCRGDALPLATGSADLLLLIHVLEDSPAPSLVLADAARVLRGEGRLVVVERWFPTSPAGWPFLFGGRFADCHRLRRLIEAAGLEWRGGADFAPPPRRGARRTPCRRLGYASHAALAVKRVAGMRVLRPAWKDRRARSRVWQEHGQTG